MITIPGLKMPKDCLDCPFCQPVTEGEFDCIVHMAIKGFPLIVSENIDCVNPDCPLVDDGKEGKG